MNRHEKKLKARAKKQAAKLARYKRSGGKSRYARKLEWRNRAIGGRSIPALYPGCTWEQAMAMHNAVAA